MTVKMYLFTLVSQGVSMPGMGGQYAPEYPPKTPSNTEISITVEVFNSPAHFCLKGRTIVAALINICAG